MFSIDGCVESDRVDCGPPNIFDHDGITHNLYTLDGSALRALLLMDGQHVAQSVVHRASMADLQGLDPHLVNIDKTAMPALDAALVGSLQDGAFNGNSVDSKYDVTKQKDCPTCGTPDHPAHCLQRPKYQAECEAMAGVVF